MTTIRDTTEQGAHDRSSIWTIPDGWEGTYLWLFVLQVLAWASLMTWRTSCCGTESNVFDAILAVGTGMAAIMVTSAGTSMILVEGIVIYAEKFLRKRYAEGKAEGIAEGKAKGIAEGKAKGIAEGKAKGIAEGKKATNEAWERWYRTLTEAGLSENDLPPPPLETEDD